MAGKRRQRRGAARQREKLTAADPATARVPAASRKVVAVLRTVVAALRGKVAALADPAGLLRRTLSRPPPGPFRPGTWRSPLRGQWLTSLLGLVLLVGLTILAVTGLLSYAAYNPRLPGNDETSGAGLLKFYLFSWPTHPSWLYRVDQGTHITLGLALVPFVLAKLWSVLPKLFTWPPVRSAAQALERLSLIMIVGGVLFEFATGILDIQNYYVFPFSFYTAHLYGAWVFIAGLVTHVTLKFPHMLAGLRSRSLRRELRDPAVRDAPRGTRPGGPAGSVPGSADHLAARAAGRSRRCLGHPGRAGRRPVDRRVDPPHRDLRPPGALRHRSLPGQQDRRLHRPGRRGRR